MRLCRSWLALGLVSVLSAPLLLRAATVYKWTDADGVVHFSDQPVPGAEKIVTDGSSTRGILNQSAPAVPTQQSRPPTALATTHISIDSPAPDQTYSGSEAMIAIATVEPPLQPNGPVTISWSLDGTPLSDGDGVTHFSLPPDIARGTHTLGATLTDAGSGESKSASPVSFTVLRPSVLSPQHK